MSSQTMLPWTVNDLTAVWKLPQQTLKNIFGPGFVHRRITMLNHEGAKDKLTQSLKISLV